MTRNHRYRARLMFWRGLSESQIATRLGYTRMQIRRGLFGVIA